MVRYLDENKERFGVEPICRTLEIAPSTYYAASSRPPSARAIADEVLKAEITSAYEENYGVYGVAKIWKALLLEAHYTTHIEGTHLTVAQAEQLWAGDAVAQASEDDARELLNYRDAFELVAGYLESGEPITESLVREIHRRLVEGVRGGEGQPGQYRAIQNAVVNSVTRKVIYMPPPPHDVAPLMQELVAWLGRELPTHPVLVAGIAQFQLVHIHPFVDGNGRASRLLSTLCLYRSGYDFKRLFTLSEFYDRDRDAFYRAIQSVRGPSLDLTGWLEYFVEGLATQLAEVVAVGRRTIATDLRARQHRLNKRQALAIDELAATGELDIARYQSLCPDVSRRTLQRDLAGLEALGLVKRVGRTNHVADRLAPEDS